MRLKAYQWGELVGVLLLLASTATQIFYVEPTRREIEWRLQAFAIQQTGAVQAKAIYAGRIATLEALGAPTAAIAAAKAEQESVLAQYKTADANIADYLIEKEPIEGALQMLVVALFGVGTLLVAIGRVGEMMRRE